MAKKTKHQDPLKAIEGYIVTADFSADGRRELKITDGCSTIYTLHEMQKLKRELNLSDIYVKLEDGKIFLKAYQQVQEDN